MRTIHPNVNKQLVCSDATGEIHKFISGFHLLFPGIIIIQRDYSIQMRFLTPNVRIYRAIQSYGVAETVFPLRSHQV
jgi:hypothetical protein